MVGMVRVLEMVGMPEMITTNGVGETVKWR